MIDDRKCFKTGTLVRFLYGDEYLSANEERMGFEEEDAFGDTIKYFAKEMQPPGIRAYLNLSFAKEADAQAESWDNDGDIDIPFGSNGMTETRNRG